MIAHWNNMYRLCVDMSLHSDTLFWFHVISQKLLFIFLNFWLIHNKLANDCWRFMANKQQQKPTNFEHHNMGHTFLPKYQFHHICGSEKNTFFLKFKSIRKHFFFQQVYCMQGVWSCTWQIYLPLKYTYHPIISSACTAIRWLSAGVYFFTLFMSEPKT